MSPQVAGTRIRSEIYRHRTRVGQYRRRAANEALDRLLSSQQTAGDARKSAPSPNAEAATSRQAFRADSQEVRRRPPSPHHDTPSRFYTNL